MKHLISDLSASFLLGRRRIFWAGRFGRRNPTIEFQWGRFFVLLLVEGSLQGSGQRDGLVHVQVVPNVAQSKPGEQGNQAKMKHCVSSLLRGLWGYSGLVGEEKSLQTEARIVLALKFATFIFRLWCQAHTTFFISSFQARISAEFWYLYPWSAQYRDFTY